MGRKKIEEEARGEVFEYEPMPELAGKEAHLGMCDHIHDGTEAFQVALEGRTVIAYEPKQVKLQPLREVLQALPFVKKTLNGQETESVQFGFMPGGDDRQEHRAGELLWSRKYKKESAVLYEYAALVDALYKQEMEDTRAAHLEACKKNLPRDFLLRGSPWTNGIVNKTNSLVLHYDTGTYPGAATGTIVLRGGVTGGFLVFPELRLAVECQDGSRTVFDGGLLLHGVTKMAPVEEDAYRYSVVYYTMTALDVAKQKEK